MTTLKEDLLPLQRALRALDDAQKRLKEFARVWSVAENEAFTEKTTSARELIRKARKRCGEIAQAAARVPSGSIEDGLGTGGRRKKIAVSNSVLTAILWQKMRRCPDCPKGGIPIAIVSAGRSDWKALISPRVARSHPRCAERVAEAERGLRRSYTLSKR